ncbi:TetR/AcrR family transcriptional regulator [Abyssalbus ytuae]|uniref:TetR/AcrR family transcriptional regulator n=1 Tax=Abyssalbus ytuae TaxID=2926907 RepID=A0A9E7D363_9FLAO|nr:TetR/AcrR family transcriptional regulator [Abyssalbus ytuae]UOB17499.1 TetR/AcrR family transcriptional regulator [Abyssalbus ytuae]
MKDILSNLKININEGLFLKDPESSKLGKKIIEHSILMIYEQGFDNFTFKKLGEKIGSNESSVYRYFENKHKLLLYLTSWYWGWVEYKLVFTTNSISNIEEKLTKAIEIVTQPAQEDSSFSHINEVLLSSIVISEHSKSYLTKEVDKDNKEGFFLTYKRLVNRLSDMVLEINPGYLYPKSLMSTVMEGALHQHFLKDHFKSITNCGEEHSPTDFFIHLIFTAIKK